MKSTGWTLDQIAAAPATTIDWFMALESAEAEYVNEENNRAQNQR